uniref:tubulin polyglutamylase TTLL11-like n=1 Tax=Styela clava TaxID=7725 RepID=UPI0019394620|nr:tubulin polyglutamylase TTLL11-like [Styela clava]
MARDLCRTIPKMRIKWWFDKPHMEIAIERLGWEKVPEDENADFYWHDKTYYADLFEHEPKLVGVNKIPGILELCTKARLSEILTTKKAINPNIFQFHPKTWILPQQYKQFTEETKQENKVLSDGELATYYIYKPSVGTHGNGIFLANGSVDIQTEDNNYIVQKYLDPPLLIEGYKFDLRFYVVIARVDPPEIYLCNEGLVRLCTTKYESPCDKNCDDIFMHLTNYKINVHNKSFQQTPSPSTGSKRTWKSVKETLRERGCDVETATRRIKELCVNTSLVLLDEVKQTQEINPYRTRWFHILGFDVILDSDMQPYLLEINSAPRLGVVHHNVPDLMGKRYILNVVDQQIKIPLIVDVLKLVTMGEKNVDMTSSCLERIFPINNEEDGANGSCELGHGILEQRLNVQ